MSRPIGCNTAGLRMCRLLDRLRAKPGRWLALDELAPPLGVSIRTVRRDIAALMTVYPIRLTRARIRDGVLGATYMPVTIRRVA